MQLNVFIKPRATPENLSSTRAASVLGTESTKPIVTWFGRPFSINHGPCAICGLLVWWHCHNVMITQWSLMIWMLHHFQHTVCYICLLARCIMVTIHPRCPLLYFWFTLKHNDIEPLTGYSWLLYMRVFHWLPNNGTYPDSVITNDIAKWWTWTFTITISIYCGLPPLL